MTGITPVSRDRARRLRRDQTDAEGRLWHFLRDRHLVGAKFRRQHPIGPFIVDFCCPDRHLIVEVDGGQHATQAVKRGYRVLRFWANDVLRETDAVLTRIAETVNPHADPLPGRERR